MPEVNKAPDHPPVMAGAAQAPSYEGHAVVEVLEALNKFNQALERARHWGYYFQPQCFSESVTNGRITHRSVGVQLQVSERNY